ncbi:MAG: DNA-formamidopyrimidine glycosylase family protein, partial [Pseudomonadota bacterium]
MPELPEVETTKRALERRLEGARIERLVQHRADLRFPLPADLPARLSRRR